MHHSWTHLTQIVSLRPTWQDTNSSSAIKEMQQGLDSDSDGKVDFKEYLSLIGYIANSMSQSKSEPTANSS